MKARHLVAFILRAGLVVLIATLSALPATAAPDASETTTPASQLLTNVKAIAIGGSHSCALTEDGDVKCWGRNVVGQLGSGTLFEWSRAVDVVGLGSGAVAITAGSNHTCALTTAGGVKCWGLGRFGQLGDGSSTDQPTPVDVAGLDSGVIAVAAGGLHTCAVTAGGGVKCWGLNDNGQLGNGSNLSSGIPVDVPDLPSGVAAIAAGGLHTCAVTVGGGVKCWGWNDYGQLGNDTFTSSNTPVDVVGLAGTVDTIAAGNAHTCAVITGGGLQCWGANAQRGQVGDGSTADRQVPVDVVGLASGVSSVDGGGAHTCAVAAGGAKCWGGNASGQLGDGTSVLHRTPVDVVGLATGTSTVGTGELHSCAVVDSGGVKCWGNNQYGQLGNGRSGLQESQATPVDVLAEPATYDIVLIFPLIMR
jgi:alpha-tubulin suppressor-like RCC1 family protein